jgi:hypothetical protein
MSQAGIFRSLEHRNFRLFFVGQLISLHGAWTQSVAQTVILAVLTLAGWVTPWSIVGLALALGIIQAVETPIRL